MANGPFITSRDESADVALIGGKAHSLLTLQRSGLPVPAWICVPTQVHEEFLALQFAAAPQAMQAFLNHLADQVTATCQGMFPGIRSFAVRSSATVEDGPGASYAGQFESHLHVPPDRLGAAIARVLASADSARVRSYTIVRGGAAELRMAVLIQPMLDARASGVLFTADPITRDSAWSTITAALGLGEGVVQDLADADRFVISNSDGRIVENQINTKRRMVVAAQDHGTLVTEVDDAQSALPVLGNAELHELWELGRKIQAISGNPQDIEWLIDPAGHIMILQARPIAETMPEQIFDNANIVENYPGLTLPLTYSVARATYEQTFRAASAAFGVPRDTLRASKEIHANLVALVDGRMYYNVLNWYQLYLMVPGFESLVPAWEKALGLPPRVLKNQRRTARTLRVRILARITYLFLRRGAMMRSFSRHFESLRNDARVQNLSSLTALQVFEVYQNFFECISAPFQITLINDFFAQQSLSLLDQWLQRWCGSETATIRNDLLGGMSGMASMELLQSMESIAERIRGEESYRALIADSKESLTTWHRLHHEPQFAGLASLIDQHLTRFGNRTVLELKLETPGVDENPGPFLENLRTLVTADINRASPHLDPAARRSAADSRLLQRGLSWPRTALLRRLLTYTRATMRDRETLRLMRAQAYDVARRVFSHLGDRLAAVGVIAEARDVFYLSTTEVRGALDQQPAPNLKNRVAARKADYARFATVEPPPRITRGRHDAQMESTAASPDITSGTSDSPVLRGTGCSAGTAKGRARVVLDPRHAGDVSGAIIVARSTDPGWVFLLAKAAGLVVERGNMLSHIAIVGREIGIPIVSGIENATRRIQEGTLLHIDGSSGLVIMGEPP